MESMCMGHDDRSGILEMLDADARQWAINRASELMARGWQERRALSMAMTWAQQWVDCGRPQQFLPPGSGQHLMFEYDAWLICPDSGEEPTHAFEWFDEALRRAHGIATEEGGAVYVYDPNGIVVDQYESYGDSDLEESSTVHVMPLQGAWVLKHPGAEGSFRRFDSKRDAVDAARALARRDRATLVIHHRNRSIMQQMGYC